MAAAPVIFSTVPGNPPVNNITVGDELQVLFNSVNTAPVNPGDIFDPGVFVDLLVLNADGDDAPLRGETIIVPPEADGLTLRVVTQFQYADGVIEEVASAATNAVAPIPEIVATNGDDFIISRSFDDVINALGGNDTVIGQAGNDPVNGDNGNDELYGDAGVDRILAAQAMMRLMAAKGMTSSSAVMASIPSS